MEKFLNKDGLEHVWENIEEYIKNNPGRDGKSAYEIAVSLGYSGTEEQWIQSLKGPKGETGGVGPQGQKGDTGNQGPKGDTGPQGETGATGATGAAAGFGTPTATIDANTGTPSVTITASGPNTAKIFSFEFKNLRGATGAKGDKGEKGEKGDDGPQGPSGVVPNPLPIANGGTGATTASAAVGNLIAALGDPSQESSYTDLCIPMCDISYSTPYGSKESLSSIMARINNRSDKVSLANTSYTTYMARAVALVTSAPSSMTNGTIALVYA